MTATNISINELASALDGKPSGAGWTAHCPAHEDDTPSLSLSEVDGKILFRCHAGCSQDAVLEALRERGLWPGGNGNGSDKYELARYDYRDARGKVLYQVVRFEPKDFRQFNPATAEWSTKGVERVPYRLPELLAAIRDGFTIWVCEGEKDVGALVAIGLVATCNSGGCGSRHVWHDFAKYFPSGTAVVLVPDADKPGQELMSEIGSYLIDAGCDVCKIDLGFPIAAKHGKDVSDWIAEGHGLEELQELAGRAMPFIKQPEESLPEGTEKEDHTRGFRLIRASELEVMKPEYLDEDRHIERDTIASLFGDSGTCKTFLAIDISCKVAAKGGTVIYIAGEGQRGIPRRLHVWCIEHGIDLASLPLYFSMAPAQMNYEESVGQVIETIREVAQANADPALVVLDTLARNLEGDENSPADMAAFIRGIDRIRAQFHCAVLVIHHSGHMAKERSRGHSSWRNALDTEYRLDKDEIGTIRMVCTKSKDSIPPEPCAFELKQVPIPGLVDDDGKDVFSAVLVPADYEPQRVPGKAGQGKWQIKAREVLDALQERYRANLEADGRDPDTARVPLDDWRAECQAAGLPRKRFYEVKETLVAAGLVSVDHDFCSCAGPSCPVRGVLHTPPDKPDTSGKDRPGKPDRNRTANRTQTGQPTYDFDDDSPEAAP